MKKIIILFILTFSSSVLFAQEAKQLIEEINKKFSKVNDYKAEVAMKFDLPGIKIKPMRGRVYYKRPNKFRIRAKGIFFLPKDNPMKNIQTLLAKTSSYTSLISGYENIDGKRCAVVNVIPLDPNLELVIGKFWISVKEPLIYMSEITTKENGTLRTRNYYGSYAQMGLPDKIMIQVEMKKFKIPKMLAADIKKSSSQSKGPQKKTGEIYLLLTDYKINTKLKDEVFTAQ